MPGDAKAPPPRRTMTVAELRAKLAEYSDDTQVWATWEGVWAPILSENFAVKPERPGAIFIDVENY